MDEVGAVPDHERRRRDRLSLVDRRGDRSDEEAVEHSRGLLGLERYRSPQTLDRPVLSLREASRHAAQNAKCPRRVMDADEQWEEDEPCGRHRPLEHRHLE